MSDVVIRAKDLKKVYRLYAKPSYRFRDMFGLLGNRRDAYTEHAALDGVDLEIRRGEKVAIIGRNGAGKSTLLKLVTSVIEPTSGTLEVTARVHALLHIGSGFHPDFTGRENVYAYLAQMGITGADADRRCAEAIDFAELEEYIDQPFKVYSTGMGVRLMFAASTAISPELLVLDEVLAVGDAYFSQKSFQRMRALCEEEGATLLLVTHDVYSAVRLCSRVIWIDRGVIVLDGDGPTVMRAYEDSIRVQEETRLRVKNLARMESKAERVRAQGLSLLLELQSRENLSPPAVIHFAEISVRRGEERLASLPLDDSGFDQTRDSHMQREATAWGDQETWNGRLSRPMLNYGSSFHKVAGVISLPGGVDDLDDLTLHVECGSEIASELVVRTFVKNTTATVGTLSIASGTWGISALPLGLGHTHGARPEVNTTSVHGTGRIVARDPRFVDAHGTEILVLRHGDPASLLIDYEVVDPAFDGVVQAVVVFNRDGVHDVCRFIDRAMKLSARKGTVRLDIPSLRLTNATYSITIMFVEDGYFDHVQTVFYTINPGVYCCLSRFFDITVTGAGPFGSGTTAIGEGTWSCIGVNERLPRSSNR